MKSVLSLAAVVAASIHGSANAQFVDTFEPYTPGTMPSGLWRDIASTIPNPTIPSPTGSVIDTLGPSGSATRAFQITRARGTSQGIISSIQPADSHFAEADIRIDSHPTPERYGNWNAAFGFIQDRGVAPDINQNPQGVVYVYQSRWYFFGATNFFSNIIEVRLSETPVVAGAWYHVEIGANALTGAYQITVRNSSGGVDVSRSVNIPNWVPSLGRYNSLAAFDGDYAAGSVQSGQFTIDNVSYVPGPSGAAIVGCCAASVLGRRRRR